jgi:hypothetical protein
MNLGKISAKFLRGECKSLKVYLATGSTFNVLRQIPN